MGLGLLHAPSQAPPPDGRSGLSAELLQTCSQTGSLHDSAHVQDLLYNLLLQYGHELQLLQNSYNTFDLLSQVGTRIHSHLLQLRRYKLTTHDTPTLPLHSRLKRLRRVPLALNPGHDRLRKEALALALARTARAINVWAYRPGVEPAPERAYAPPPPVNCVAFDTTGKAILTGGGNGVIKIWHSHTGNQILALARHPGAITCIDVHAANAFVASTCDGGECRLWEIRGAWWRLGCTIRSPFKFLWCKFTRLHARPAAAEDALVCACGDGSMQLHLLADLAQGRSSPLRTFAMTNLRAYDISQRKIPWLAVGLESADAEASDQSSRLGVAAVMELDRTGWGAVAQVRHRFLWDPPNQALWSDLQRLGYLSQLDPAQPLAPVQPGPLSHKFSLTITDGENSDGNNNCLANINCLSANALFVISALHQESPDVCFGNLSRNLVTASDDGNAFLWNAYTGASVKLVTKCMDSFASRVSKQSDQSAGPIYTVTCLEWSCDDSLVYVGDSIYSHGNSRKSLSSMRTIESGFTVFDASNGHPIGHGLHRGSCHHLSAIKGNPLLPHVALVVSYSGCVYIFTVKVDKKTEPHILKKIDCGPGACWLDAAWHPSGSMFVLSQKFGCFSVFAMPTFTYSAPDVACATDESLAPPDAKADRFVFGCEGLFTVRASGFVPVHHSFRPELAGPYQSEGRLVLAEPSEMGHLEGAQDDLEAAQAGYDAKQFIHAHRHCGQDFDGIFSCFHHLQVRNFGHVERFHDWESCPVCAALVRPPARQHRQRVRARRAGRPGQAGHGYSEYGDHASCLPPAVKAQIKSLRSEGTPRVAPKKVLQTLLDAPSFDSDDSDDSDFTASPVPVRARRPSAYPTRRARRGSSPCPSSSSSSSSPVVARRRRRARRAQASSPPGAAAAVHSRPKVVRLGPSSIDHASAGGGACTICGVAHYCFACALAGGGGELGGEEIGGVDFMVGRVDDALIGPVLMERQALEVIAANAGAADLLLEDAGSPKHAGIFLHRCCLVAIDLISFQPNGIAGLDKALYRASETKCSLCGCAGAALRCKDCGLPFHARCSFRVHRGARVYPNALVGDFICAACAGARAADYMSGASFAGLSRGWMLLDPLLQARSTRSRLRAQFAYRRLAGKGSEWVPPQQGDILWFDGLAVEPGLTPSDALIPLYLHYTHIAFAALVTEVTPLFSGTSAFI